MSTLKHIGAALLRPFVRALQPAAKPRLRAGLLDTGELVLIDAAGAVRTLSVDEAETVRDVLLAADAYATDHALLPTTACTCGAAHCVPNP